MDNHNLELYLRKENVKRRRWGGKATGRQQVGWAVSWQLRRTEWHTNKVSAKQCDNDKCSQVRTNFFPMTH